MNSLGKQGTQLIRLLGDLGVGCVLKNSHENNLVQHFDFDLTDLRLLPKVKKLVDIIKLCMHEDIIFVNSETNHFALEIKKNIDKIMYKDYAKLEENNKYSALIGLNYNAEPIYYDVQKSIHTLVGGATGMGKTSLINNILYSLSKKNTKDTLQLCLIDTKKTLSLWEDLPQLMFKPATDCHKAYNALTTIIDIMEKRHSTLAKLKQQKATEGQFPYILVVIDEFGDLMLSALKKRVEEMIIKIARLGRSVNISLLIATQNPIAKVCTSDIKANCPTVIALKTVSIVTSRVILDNKNAFMLDGVGNAIIRPANNPNETTFKVCYLEEEEIKEYLKGVK